MGTPFSKDDGLQFHAVLLQHPGQQLTGHLHLHALPLLLCPSLQHLQHTQQTLLQVLPRGILQRREYQLAGAQKGGKLWLHKLRSRAKHDDALSKKKKKKKKASFLVTTRVCVRGALLLIGMRIRQCERNTAKR